MTPRAAHESDSVKAVALAASALVNSSFASPVVFGHHHIDLIVKQLDQRLVADADTGQPAGRRQAQACQ